MNFNLQVLKIDPARELKILSEFVVDQVSTGFRRKGVMVGLSGGIDSACMAAVAVHALGKEKVVGLILPEAESNPISSEYATKHAQALEIEHRQIDITPTVDSVVEYKSRDQFLQKLIPRIQDRLQVQHNPADRSPGASELQLLSSPGSDAGR